MTGEYNLLAIICGGTCIILTGKQNFKGEATETRRGECFKLKLGGKTHFSGGSSFYLGGAAFQRGRYSGSVGAASQFPPAQNGNPTEDSRSAAASINEA